MKLTARLKSIAQFIPRCCSVADIGTDHALLPIYLIREDIAERAIASDLNRGPLEAAKNNVAKAGLTERISLRLGNGLEVVCPGEVNVCVIAGMGGPAIRDIIDQGNQTSRQIGLLVLQPMSGAGALREWLVDNGWRIGNEDLVKEDGRIYEIMVVLRGVETVTDRAIITVGPRLFEKRHPLLTELLLLELRQKKDILESLTRVSNLDDVAEKRQELEERNLVLERIIECL